MRLRGVPEAALYLYLVKPVVLAELRRVPHNAATLHDQLVARA